MTDDARSYNTIRSDRWDRDDAAKIREELAELRAAQEALGEITPTARPEITDAFLMVHKAEDPAGLIKDASEVRDDHRTNLAVNIEAIDLPELTALRRFTKGDLVAAGMAVVDIEPRLEELFDRNKHVQQAADELQRLRDELAQKIQDLLNQQAQQPQPQPGDGEGEDGEGEGEGQEGEGQEGEGQGEGGDGEGQGQGQGQGEGQGEGQGQGQGQGQQPSLEQQIEDLKRMIEAAEKGLVKMVEGMRPDVQATMGLALNKAATKAADERTNARTWGVEPGELKRLPAKERLELARKWNKPHLREIAAIFGRYVNVALSPVLKTVDDIPHERTGVRFSRDISHMIPSELLRLKDPRTKRAFLKDFAEGKILTSKFRGKEKVGKGGMVVLLDSSMSMSGEREKSAKAITLVLGNIAKRENREFHVVHFGSPGLFTTQSFLRPGDFTTDRLIEMAELFLSSGTDFVTPLNEGIRLLEDEHRRTGRITSDIIMITDGECGVTDTWLADFHARLDKLGATVFGINVAGEAWGNTLDLICRDLVMTLADLTSDGLDGGKKLKKLFAHVQRRAAA